MNILLKNLSMLLTTTIIGYSTISIGYSSNEINQSIDLSTNASSNNSTTTVVTDKMQMKQILEIIKDKIQEYSDLAYNIIYRLQLSGNIENKIWDFTKEYFDRCQNIQQECNNLIRKKFNEILASNSKILNQIINVNFENNNSLNVNKIINDIQKAKYNKYLNVMIQAMNEQYNTVKKIINIIPLQNSTHNTIHDSCIMLLKEIKKYINKLDTVENSDLYSINEIINYINDNKQNVKLTQKNADVLLNTLYDKIPSINENNNTNNKKENDIKETFFISKDKIMKFFNIKPLIREQFVQYRFFYYIQLYHNKYESNTNTLIENIKTIIDDIIRINKIDNPNESIDLTKQTNKLKNPYQKLENQRAQKNLLKQINILKKQCLNDLQYKKLNSSNMEEYEENCKYNNEFIKFIENNIDILQENAEKWFNTYKKLKKNNNFENISSYEIYIKQYNKIKEGIKRVLTSQTIKNHHKTRNRTNTNQNDATQNYKFIFNQDRVQHILLGSQHVFSDIGLLEYEDYVQIHGINKQQYYKQIHEILQLNQIDAKNAHGENIKDLKSENKTKILKVVEYYLLNPLINELINSENLDIFPKLIKNGINLSISNLNQGSNNNKLVLTVSLNDKKVICTLRTFYGLNEQTIQNYKKSAEEANNKTEK